MASPASHSPVTLSAASTPPTSAPSSPETLTPVDPLDDIFSSSPRAEHVNTHPTQESLSDLPALRRQHVTAGYREGLAIAKAKTIQDGFDAGYPLGADLGLRVGRVFGTLETIVAAMEKAGKDADKIKVLLTRAKRELVVSSFLEGISDEDLGASMVQGTDGEQATKTDAVEDDNHGAAITAGQIVFSPPAMERLEAWENAISKFLPPQAS